MNYYFRKHLPVQDSIQLVAKELVIDAINECRTDLLSPKEIVHSVRKKCKRIRALLRIVRLKIGPLYKIENIFFRDAARKLSDIRDRHVTSDTLKKIKDISKEEKIRDGIDKMIENFTGSENEYSTRNLIREFEKEISGSIVRIEKWEVNADGFSAVKGGLEKTYTRGRLAMRKAFNEPTDENFHQWRKRVKYHYYHLELLSPVWENVLRVYSEEAHSLAEKLGYLHDLSLLKNLIHKNSSLTVDQETAAGLVRLIKSEQDKLMSESYLLGKRIYAEKSSIISNKIGKWWSVWHNDEIIK